MITDLNTRQDLPKLLWLGQALAISEVVVALREPQRKITTLLRNRAVQLQDDASALAELDNSSLSNPNWGLF